MSERSVNETSKGRQVGVNRGSKNGEDLKDPQIQQCSLELTVGLSLKKEELGSGGHSLKPRRAKLFN